MNYTVRELGYADVSDATVKRMEELLNQLSTRPCTLTLARLHAVFNSPSCILIAEDDASGEILGMVTLVVPAQLIGKRAWGEDLVVDKRYRRNGIARALMQGMIDLAEELGVERIQSTSSRPASQELVLSLGFQQRSTNVYAIDLKRNLEETK